MYAPAPNTHPSSQSNGILPPITITNNPGKCHQSPKWEGVGEGQYWAKGQIKRGQMRVWGTLYCLAQACSARHAIRWGKGGGKGNGQGKAWGMGRVGAQGWAAGQQSRIQPHMPFSGSPPTTQTKLIIQFFFYFWIGIWRSRGRERREGWDDMGGRIRD